MKNRLVLIICSAALFAIASCSGKNEGVGSQQPQLKPC